MKQIYIIEHLEPKLWPWCVIEYKNISKIVGKNNLWFTNIKKSDSTKLKKYGRVIKDSAKSIKLENCCVLDPEAEKLLNPKEAKQFNYFIFGGILGDYPPRKRTKTELTKFLKKYKKRNLGKEQMATDNAVYVAKKIILGTPIKKIKFINSPEIVLNKSKQITESTILPYKYPLKNNKPLISKEIINYLKKNDEWKSH